jgi:hypothetical protein
MGNTFFKAAFVSLAFLTNILIAQIHVDNNGRVGVGTETPSSSSKLHLISNSNASSQSLFKIEYTGSNRSHHKGISSVCAPAEGYGYGGWFKGGHMGVYAEAGETWGYYTSYGIKAVGGGGSSNYGVHASSSKYGLGNYGVYGYATDGEYANVGVYGYTNGMARSTNYGVYGRVAGGGSGKYAGYFYGNVKVVGTITTASDARLKNNVKGLGKSIDKIKQLKPKRYQFKQSEKLSLAGGAQFGLTAQDLEKIYPELVEESEHFFDVEEKLTKEKKPESIMIKSVNYTGLIPILIKGIQEQQAVIENQQAQVDNLVKQVNRLAKRVRKLEGK